jgi:predicted nuclease with RNAse H fold
VTRALGIDLGGAASATTGWALLDGDDAPRLVEPPRVLPRRAALEAERELRAAIAAAQPDVVAIDAPLSLPPCLTCPSDCPGPGPDACVVEDGRWLWERGHNGLSQRRCEAWLVEHGYPRPLPTMQLGVLTARAIGLRRWLGQRGLAVLEVYPRLTRHQLGNDARLAALVGDATGHAADAVVAAYTAWLPAEDLEPPQAGDWITFPRARAPGRAPRPSSPASAPR